MGMNRSLPDRVHASTRTREGRARNPEGLEMRHRAATAGSACPNL